MTRKEALEELLVKVKAGSAPEYSLFREAYVKTCWQDIDMKEQGVAWEAYNGSMDAALSLFEAVLPGWTWGTDVSGVVMRLQHQTNWTLHSKGVSDTPSRALLIAILEALAGMEGG